MKTVSYDIQLQQRQDPGHPAGGGRSGAGGCGRRPVTVMLSADPGNRGPWA